MVSVERNARYAQKSITVILELLNFIGVVFFDV
jgi:hypothetical protein